MVARAVFCILLLAPAFADAKTCSVESRAHAFDVPLLARLAQKGDLALIEATPSGAARQVIIFSILDAPPEKVWDKLMDVASYPKFLRTIVSTKVTRRDGPLIAFDWEMDVPFFNLKGARAQRGQRPHLIEVRGLSGNLRGSRERWELFPIDGGKKTLAAFYRAIDVETGGLLLETMIKLEPSMEQGTNLSTGFVHMRALQTHLANLPPFAAKVTTGPVPPFRSLVLGPQEIDLTRLKGLLEHGQLALIETNADGALTQVALLTVVNAPKDKMIAIVRDPAKYPEFIHNFAEQTVTPQNGNQLKMEWELEVPLTNLDGVSIMTLEDNGAVDVIAESGDIKRGRWRWEFNSISDDVTIPIHYAYTDIREASWVTKKILDKEPLFEHGIVIASGTVALTAMKARAEGRR